MQTTVDTILSGRIFIEQPAKGYRFNIDAILLAFFGHEVLSKYEIDSIIEFGSGSGVIGFLLSSFHPSLPLIMVERQPELFELLRKNIKRNQFHKNIHVIDDDLRHLTWTSFLKSKRTLALFNPPFYKVGHGRISPIPSLANGRHERHGGIQDLVDAIGKGLKENDLLALVFDTQRADELSDALRRASFIPLARRMILPYRDQPSKRFVILAKKKEYASLSLEQSENLPLNLEPWVIHRMPGRYTETLDRILSGESW